MIRTKKCQLRSAIVEEAEIAVLKQNLGIKASDDSYGSAADNHQQSQYEDTIEQERQRALAVTQSCEGEGRNEEAG